MASSKLQLYPNLPAPAILSVPQSKSHVLAGVQDAYWSDEEEDQECPLCLEEMDVSDLNFKPCVCGYQICRFCWHHIKENLNKRCPACRRIYTDETVEFKPVATQDHKRLTQQKKQRDREKKELETLGRRHLANVRVVQRNVVYVVGIGPRFAKEELIPTLRSNEYFGQYGKISKILIVKRTPPGGTGPVIGLYITYTRREDAARAIAAVDGAASPGGGREIMRASYGTTKYCMAFLRNVTCNDHNCMNLHEWGDEKDCFTKEDLTTLKHTMKTTETRAKTTIVTRKDGEDASLPRAASWGQKSSTPVPSSATHAPSSSSLVRQTRRNGPARRTGSGTPSNSVNPDHKPMTIRIVGGKAIPSHNSASRPSTPAQVTPAPSVPSTSSTRPASAASPALVPAVASVVESKPARSKKEKEKEREKEKTPSPIARETESPAPSLATESDVGSASQEAPRAKPPSRPESAELVASPALLPQPVLPAPAVPPGLSAPPGIPSPSRPPRHATDSPQTPLLASQSSYQMSNAARALLDDVKARREPYIAATTAISPFPEFDRTLQTLAAEDGGGFSFNLDPKLADQAGVTDTLPELEMDANTAFQGSFVDAFPALRSTPQLIPPPGLGYPRPSSRSIFEPPHAHSPPVDKLSNYMGSFNPFSDNAEGRPSLSSSPNSGSPFAPFDEDRKVSRFGFARGRQGTSAASSPLNGSSHLAPADMNSLHSTMEDHNGPPGLGQLRWDTQRSDYGNSQPPSMMNSPLLHNQPAYAPQSRFQPFESDVSEAQLREFIQVSRDREFQKPMNDGYKSNQPFQDPAIMSASFGPPQPRDMSYNSMAYGPPPGLGMVSHQQMGAHSNGMPTALAESNPNVATTSTSTSSPALSLSVADFPALVSPAPKEDPSPTKLSALSLVSTKAQEKTLRKAAKKAAAAERAAERAKVAAAKIAAKAKAPVEDPKVSATQEPTKSVSTIQPPATPTPKKEAEVAKTPTQAAPPAAELKTPRKAQKEEKPAPKDKAPNTKPTKRADASSTSQTPKPNARASKPPALAPIVPVSDVATEVQTPILSKKPKKNKPIVKTPKPARDDDFTHGEPSAGTQFSKARSPSKTPERRPRLTVEELMEDISRIHPGMDLISHPFFDLEKLSSTAKMPLEYGPLVHALSALSVGGGSFANNVPSGSIDTAVSSFQQLLETLTQTISDLLRLLPRTTWDDSSSFDGVLRDMLKGDDFLDEAGEDGQGKDDEVAALTLALERRARWMEVQLSKLEELHRDINTAAVKAVLAFNDNGWDKYGFLPRLGNTLERFESIGLVTEGDGDVRPMTVEELEKVLMEAKEAAVLAEADARDAMAKMQFVKHFDDHLY